MGLTGSKPNRLKVIQKDGDHGQFVMVSNEPADLLQFDPVESYAVSYGIDRQTSPNNKLKKLLNTCNDAKVILDALVAARAILPTNVFHFAASKSLETCTVAGMKQTFQEQALKVGPNGLFVFHFSGHGIRISSLSSGYKMGLAAVDFDPTTLNGYLTADILSNWLNEVQCKAKHILITLDCCYAGGIGKELTSFIQTPPNEGLHVISACTAYEKSVVFGTLRNTIFTYFLSHAIKTQSQKGGELPLKDIFKECQVCSQSLSSLYIKYCRKSGLMFGTMQPQVESLHPRKAHPRRMPVVDGDDSEIDGRYQYAIDLYDCDKPIPTLDWKSIGFLETICTLEHGSLLELQNRQLLREEVFLTALASMMYSIASIELVSDPNHAKVQNPNHSITAFLEVIATLEKVNDEIHCPENVFYLGWRFYYLALKNHNVDVTGLDALCDKLSQSPLFNAPPDRSH